jgi:poly-beta-1,6-N-acetyl-D-glucosamine synthase
VCSSARSEVTLDANCLRYVLVTPARNEEQYIRRTLESVVSQTHLPLRWVIVNDGSADRTASIVTEFCRGRDWIELIQMPEHRDRSFAAKAQCFNAGFERLKQLDFDVVGNLDADISFDREYFDFLMRKFAENPRLGVAGTPFVEGDSHYDFRFSNIEHVSGACQMFRRECFEEIGGYIPIKAGGIDWTAVTTARMNGWTTRTFREKSSVHNKPMRTGAKTELGSIFRHGQRDYYLGGHPLWQLFRSSYQMSRPPYVIGGLSLLAGYVWAGARRVKRPVSRNLMEFHRSEQMARLRGFFGRIRRTEELTS